MLIDTKEQKAMMIPAWGIILLCFLIPAFCMSEFFNIRFARSILEIQDNIEEALDVLDSRYNVIAQILEKPVFFDSIEIRQVMTEILKSYAFQPVIANSPTLWDPFVSTVMGTLSSNTNAIGKRVYEKTSNFIKNNDTKTNPIWLMRQAGRYLPEFREIRKKNTDFIKLCLNSDLASEITLQPIKRFGFDGAVIFSDILMLPYGLGQKVEFEKNFGPKLGEIELENLKNVDEINFTEKVYKVYKAISKTSQDPLMNNKDMIGFVGAPWTILVYMINRSSPKKGLSSGFFKDELLINRLLGIIEKFLIIKTNYTIS